MASTGSRTASYSASITSTERSVGTYWEGDEDIDRFCLSCATYVRSLAAEAIREAIPAGAKMRDPERLARL